MPATYEPIATTTLGSAASTITFSSISSAYTDLRLIFNINVDTASRICSLRFNSDTATNYSSTYLSGNGTAAGTGRNTSVNLIYLAGNSTVTPSTAGQWASYQVDVFSYAGSTNKTALSQIAGDQNGSGSVFRGVHLYRSTSAITSLTILLDGSGNFTTGTTATLYGILKA